MSDFLMPSLGADMEDAKFVAWHVKPGDRVSRGQVIAEVDTAKGVIEIECFASGIVEQLIAEQGKTYPVGARLAVLAESGDQSIHPSQVPAASAAPVATRQSQPPPVGPSVQSRASQASRDPARRKITPLARRRAAELGIDLAKVQASGAGGEMSVEDVERFKKLAVQPVAELPQAVTLADVAEASRNRLRVAIAAAMAKSKREIPHYYLQAPIDMSSPLEWLRKENQQRPLAKRILPIAMSLKAMALALRDVPELNGHWMDGRLRMSAAIHIGFAIAMKGGGLVAPAIRDVDQMSVDALMTVLHDLIPRARTGPLRSSEMSEGTITLTNLGDLGVQSVFGVIYPPQVAIVGMGKIAPQPWAENDVLSVRPVMMATVSGDHRASDGLRGAQFLESLTRYLQQPQQL